MSKIRMERHFRADPATVFAFITEPANLPLWWGPEGMSLPERALDFTQPGPWRSVMMSAEGKRFTVSGEVVSVSAPLSVELTWAWHDEAGARGHESRVRFDVRPAEGGGTRFIVTHSGLASEESAANHRQGWESSFAKLERMAA